MIRQPHAPLATKALVIGAPRSGFALLLNILGEIWRVPHTAEAATQRAANILLDPFGEYLYQGMITALERHYDSEAIYINQTFRPLLGGPMWLDTQDSGLACVRKYVGVRDVGDMSLVIQLPKKTLYYHDRVHSHYHPRAWLEDPDFSNLIKFASMRNPLATLCSTAHSINAITGEYINRHIGDEGDLRQRFAKFRLSDHALIGGLVANLGAYLKEFVSVKEAYHMVKWEDILTLPADTIMRVAKWRGRDIDRSEAERIWHKISYRNLTGAHQYNFRKARDNNSIDDWKHYLTNQHLEMMRDAGMEEYMEMFGYGKIGMLDETDYTPFQHQVSHALASGHRIDEGLEDKNLQIFNWNKSNLSGVGEGFVQLPKGRFSQVERACFSNRTVLDELSEKVDGMMSHINEMLANARAILEDSTTASWHAKCEHLAASMRESLAAPNTPGLDELLDKRLQLIATLAPQP